MLWPVYSPSFLCMTRATVSVPPPGANPTTTVTGRVGYVWAVAFAAMASAAASAMMSFMLLLLFSLTTPFIGRLFSLEHGLALLHEGSASFDVVLALEAGFDQRGARLGVEGRAPLEQLAHDALRRPDRERRVLRDHRAVLENERLELGDRRHAVHEAHRLRFLGLELAAGDEHFARVGWTDDVDQVFQRRGAIAEAELRRGDAETRVLGRDPEVRAQGDVDSRPEAIPADHGDDHLVAGLQALGHPAGDFLVALNALRGRAVLLVLRDVGSGDEGFVAFALQHDHANLGIALEAVEHLRDRLPHVDGDGVAARRIVEREPADRALFFRDDALGQLACREGRLFPEGEELFLGHGFCSFD